MSLKDKVNKYIKNKTIPIIISLLNERVNEDISLLKENFDSVKYTNERNAEIIDDIYCNIIKLESKINKLESKTTKSKTTKSKTTKSKTEKVKK